MTDPNVTAMVTACAITVGLIAQIVLQVLARADAAKAMAIAKSTHLLVNSSMAQQLRISLVALKRVAELTKHPDDVAAMNLAQAVYREHEARQAKTNVGAATVAAGVLPASLPVQPPVSPPTL